MALAAAARGSAIWLWPVAFMPACRPCPFLSVPREAGL